MSVGKDVSLTKISQILRIDAEELTGTIAGARYNQQNNLEAALIDVAKVIVHPMVGLYQIVFGRKPDAAGLDYWVGEFLTNGHIPDTPDSLTAIAARFTASDEWLASITGLNNEGVVRKLYQQSLGRTPDDEGLSFWVGQLNGGRPVADLVVDFSLSPEFITRVTPFVDDLLEKAAAGADPDPTSRLIPADLPPTTNVPAPLDTAVVSAHIAAILRVQPSDYLVQSFQGRFHTVAELDSVLLDIAAVTVAPILSLYQIAFNRLPDEAGLDYWVGRLGGGTLGEIDVNALATVSEAFVNSQEWQLQYGGGSTTQLVTALYRQALGRDPDTGGLAFWVGKLESGEATPASFLIDFSTTPEFVGRTARLIDATLQDGVTDGIDEGRSLFTLDLVTLDNGIGASDSLIGNTLEDWAVDRQALKAIRTGETAGEHGKVIEFVVDKEATTTGHHRYQGAKLTDHTAGSEKDGYPDLLHGAEVSIDFYIDQWWAHDGREQVSGVWVQMQDQDKSLPDGGVYSIAEFIDPYAAETLNIRMPDGEVFAGGFRFWNSDVGWVKLVEFDTSGWVSLSFAFTGEAHVWSLNGQEVYRQVAIGDSGNAQPNAVDKADILETVIVNSQNFGNEETYRYDNIELVGVSANQHFYPHGIDAFVA